MMPKNLVLIRHGESEGNVVMSSLKKGDNSFYTQEFKKRHDADYRLSKKGVEQAQRANEFIQKNFSGINFDKLFVSSFLRAIETASYINLNKRWTISWNLTERDWGDFGTLTPKEREKKFARSLEIKKSNPFDWRPQNGESMRDVVVRVKQFLDTLHRQHSKDSVAVVCHGEVMWAFRILLEEINPIEYIDIDSSRNNHDRIHNCQIIHYTRINPEKETQKEHNKIKWYRSICPWDETLSSNQWTRIEKNKDYSAEDLRFMCERMPRLFD